MWNTIWTSITFQFQRFTNICSTLLYLLSLPQKKIDGFFDSYSLYTKNWDELKTIYSKSEIRTKLQNYYHLMPFLLSLGRLDKMYIPPVLDKKKNILENQILFEKRLSRELHAHRESKILDIGCGRGLVALQVAKETNCTMYGMNIELSQIEYANKLFKAHQKNNSKFIFGDINNFPFPFEDNTFDGIYQIQVFSLASDFECTIKEVARILKPGGRFICLDWVKLQAFEEKNIHHEKLLGQVKPLIGAIGTLSAQSYCEIIEKYLHIETATDLSFPHGQSELIKQADRDFCRIKNITKNLSTWKLLPSKLLTLLERLTLYGKAFIEGDEAHIFTTSYYIIAEKKIYNS